MARFARYDRNLLAVQLEELTNLGFDEIDVTGFSVAAIDTEDPVKKKRSAAAADDEWPGPRKVVVSRRGDLWLLGPHRLLCDEAAAATNRQALMSGQQADIVLTGGPWNLPTNDSHGLGGDRHSNCAIAQRDQSEGEIVGFLSSFLRLAKESSKPGAIMFVFMDWRYLFELLTAARAQHLPLKDLIVWAKSNADLGSFYRSQHELIAVLENGYEAARILGLGQHGRHRSNLWKYSDARPIREGRTENLAIHPTYKPVALLADAIRDATDRGAVVFDPFAGTGSTLIAAEKTGRRAYVLEADPVYCDIIIRRFEAYTGKVARLDRSGLTFKEAENIRLRIGFRPRGLGSTNVS